MNLREWLGKALEAEEGRRACVYKDSEGWDTIGIGRLVDKRKKGAGLRDVEIDFMLSNDIEECTADILKALPWAKWLSEPRLAVLICMRFQMGLPNLLGFKNTLAAVRDGRYATASVGMLKSKWATQTPARARRMADQMETGKWQ